MSHSIGAAHDPSVADFRATSPRKSAGRNMIGSLFSEHDGCQRCVNPIAKTEEGI